MTVYDTNVLTELKFTSTIEKATGMLGSLVYLCAGVFFLVWQRRAFRNLRALQVDGIKNKEWYCLWGFFVPFACLFIPMSVTNEIWKASNPSILDQEKWKDEKNSVLIGCWWFAWLGYGLPNLARTMLVLELAACTSVNMVFRF